jgi:hypothetical protein
MKTYKTTETATVNNYPYGNLKTSATFGIEFKQGKGFRTTFQTINPKTGRVNNPKKSTYSPVIFMYEAENGHIKHRHLDFYGAKGINADCQTMFENFDLFTTEQIKDIYAHVFMKLKVEAKALCVYCGADFEQVKPILESSVNAAAEGMRTGENLFNQICIDIEALESTKVPDYQPFKVTSYGIV